MLFSNTQQNPAETTSSTDTDKLMDNLISIITYNILIF